MLKKPKGLRCVHIKRNGKRCGAWALKGIDRCKVHGGPRMKANIKHGLYGKYQPTLLREIIEEQRHDPRLMDLREQVAVLSGMLAHSFQSAKNRIEAAKKKDDKDLTSVEISSIVTLAEKVTVAIERTARIGLAVKMMIHVDALNRIIDLWIEAAAQYIPANKKEVFRQRLSVLCAQVLEQDKTKFKDIYYQDVDNMEAISGQ